MSTSPKASSGWLWGAVPDLLLGCGVWYLVAFGVLCLAGDTIRQSGGLVALPFLTLVFGTPHYGATLVRVYRSREDRDAYRLFTVWATLAIAAVFALGVHDALVGSAILTLYLTWSPWHYTGQNYGIAVMLARKRGAAPAPGLKRVLYLSFFLSFLLTFLAQHGGAGAGGAGFAPLSYDRASYHFLPLGFPDPWIGWAIAAVGAAYLASWIVAAVGLVRAGGLRACAPTLVLMFSQSMWFSIPLAARHWGVAQGLEPLSRDWSEYYFFWVAVAHSIQYLWVTSYYARSEGGRSGLAGYSLRTLLAGSLVWMAPALVFAPGLLGRLSFDAGLGILVAATVNIHHFVLDGAIWKLRDGRVARVLLRPRDAAPAGAVEPERGGWRAGLVWAAGALCAVFLFAGQYENRRAESALQAGDVSTARAALDRLRWMGQSSAEGRRVLGELLAQRGDLGGALDALERAVRLNPSGANWQSLGAVRAQGGDWAGAAEAYREAVATAPQEDLLHYELGVVLLRQGELAGARDAFAKAESLNPQRGIYRRMLERTEERLAAEP